MINADNNVTSWAAALALAIEFNAGAVIRKAAATAAILEIKKKVMNWWEKEEEEESFEGIKQMVHVKIS